MDKIQDKIDNFLFLYENDTSKDYEIIIGEICETISKNISCLQSHTEAIYELICIATFKQYFDILISRMIKSNPNSIVAFLEFYYKICETAVDIAIGMQSNKDIKNDVKNIDRLKIYRSIAELYPIALRFVIENVFDQSIVQSIIIKFNVYFLMKFGDDSFEALSSSQLISMINLALRIYLCFTANSGALTSNNTVLSYDVFDISMIKDSEFFLSQKRMNELKNMTFLTLKNIASISNLSYVVVMNILNVIKIITMARPHLVKDASNILEIIIVKNSNNFKPIQNGIICKFTKKLMCLVLAINRDPHINSRFIYMMHNYLKFPVSEIERISKTAEGGTKRKKSSDSNDTSSKKLENEEFTESELKILSSCINNADKAEIAATELNKIFLKNILTPGIVTDLLLKVIVSLPKNIPKKSLEIYTIYMSKQNINAHDDVIETLSKYYSDKNIGYGSKLVNKFLQKRSLEKKKEISKPKDPKEVKQAAYDFTSDALSRLFEFINLTPIQKPTTDMAKNFISFLFLFNKSIFLKKFEDTLKKDLNKYKDLICKLLYKCFILSFNDDIFLDLYSEIFYVIFDEHLSLLNNSNESLIKIITEAPCYPPGCIDKIRNSCLNLDTYNFGFHVLEALIISQNLSYDFIGIVLELTLNNFEAIRNRSVKLILISFGEEIFRENIENFLENVMHSLSESNIFPDPEKDNYNEFLVKVDFIFNILTLTHSYLLKFITIIIPMDNERNNILIYYLEKTNLDIFYESEELYACLNEMVQGNKKFVIKFYEIFDIKKNFSSNMVEHIKNLFYQNRDPLLLSLIFRYITKENIINEIALILSESEDLIKYIFSKLLNIWSLNQDNSLSPVELLILLHKYEDVVDLRILTKAISVLVSFREIYNQETLAVVLQNLVDSNPIPTLTLRMMIQSLGICPKLGSFMMGLMQKLIQKHVWKYSKLWKGFIKCCEKTKPQSLQILLQLPIRNLEDCLNMSPELHQALKIHVKKMSLNQQSLIQKSVLQVIDKNISTKQLNMDYD